MKSMMLCACVSLTACLTATVKEPAACYDKAISFDLSGALASAESQLPSGAAGTALSQLCTTGGAPSEVVELATETTYQLPPITTSTTYDFSSDLSKIGDVAKQLTIDLTQLMLSNTNGQLDFVSQVEVSISGMTLPSAPLATFTLGNSLDAHIQMGSDTLLSYLQSGPITLTITLDSNPVDLSEVCKLVGMSDLSSDATMCVSISGTFSK
jgi:hypothetical protein